MHYIVPVVKLPRQRCRIPKFRKKSRIHRWNYDSRRVQIRTTTSFWTSPHLSITNKRQQSHAAVEKFL